MKKFFYLNFLLFFILLLGGCSRIDYGVIIQPNNSISEVFQVRLDSEQLSKYNIDTSFLLSEIETQIYSWLDTQLHNRTVAGFSPQIQKDRSQFSITLILNYATMACYQNFWRIPPSSEPPQFEFHFFYDKMIVRNSPSIFAHAQKSSFAQHFHSWFLENYPESANIWTNSDFKFGYTYGLPSDAGYFSNADKTYSTDTTTYHIWEFDLSQSDRSICFYNIIIQPHNLACWWCFFLLLTALFGLFMFLKLKIPAQRTQNKKHKSISC